MVTVGLSQFQRGPWRWDRIPYYTYHTYTETHRTHTIYKHTHKSIRKTEYIQIQSTHFVTVHILPEIVSYRFVKCHHEEKWGHIHNRPLSALVLMLARDAAMISIKISVRKY